MAEGISQSFSIAVSYKTHHLSPSALRWDVRCDIHTFDAYRCPLGFCGRWKSPVSLLLGQEQEQEQEQEQVLVRGQSWKLARQASGAEQRLEHRTLTG